MPYSTTSLPITLLLLLLFTASLSALLFGGERLEAPLLGWLPLGNLLVALAHSSLAAVPWRLACVGSSLWRVARVVFYCSLSWLPVSILLAGNAELNFSGWRGSAWLAFSGVLALAILSLCGWWLVSALFSPREGKHHGS